MAEAQINAIGTTHAGISAYLLGLWGLPDVILEATAFHHTPDKKHNFVFTTFCPSFISLRHKPVFKNVYRGRHATADHPCPGHP